MNNLPTQVTSFVGRSQEVADVSAQLTDPACRMLTLVGEGGIGKTRLALQVAGRVAVEFADGAHFVPLQSISTPAYLAPAIADALHLTLSGQAPPEAQLLDLLQDVERLLVLDNYEQLLPDVELITHILESAPGVKLLVTSREVLNLQEEWLYPVEGLPTPKRDDSADVEEYDAVRLFVERARRIQPRFSLAAERATVARICRLVAGMPLAIELATSWIRSMTCEAIAAEIEHSIDILTSRMRNTPERRRSMQAVFDHSWTLLSPLEQSAFRRLPIFRGGFRREAAAHVTGASLPVLSSLVDKSLLRIDTQGRYHLHELLRQYAQARLEDNRFAPDGASHASVSHGTSHAEEAAALQDRHSAYFAEFLHERAGRIIGARQQETVREIAAELENIRAAWQHAVTHLRADDLHKSHYTLYQFMEVQSRFQEGSAAFESAVARVEAAPPGEARDRTLSELTTLLGWLYIRVGRLEEARTVLEQAAARYEKLEGPEPGFGTDPLLGLSLVCVILGDYALGQTLAEKTMLVHEARNDRLNLQIAHYMLENALYWQGDYEAALRAAQRAYALGEETDNRWMNAYVLTDLGNIARALGDYEQARSYYQSSHKIKEELGSPEGMAWALIHLGRTAYLQGSIEEAEGFFRRGEALLREIYDPGGLSNALHGLGDTALARGDYDAAWDLLRDALQIASDMGWTPHMLDVLTSIAVLRQGLGDSTQAAELLALVRSHPAVRHETRQRAASLIQEHPSGANLLESTQGLELESVIAAILASANALQASEATNSNDPPALESGNANQGLIEPLTERELEVLGLIAEGLSNREIAERLVITVGTVKTYTNHLYGKLAVASRTQAIARARELALL